MGEHSTAFPTPRATLGHDEHPRRVIARSSRAAAAGACSALVLTACTATGAGDTSYMPPMRSDGTHWFIDSTEAGTWETTGSARANGNDCSWNLFTNPPGEAEQGFTDLDWADYQISRGDAAVGEAVQVTLAVGQFFTSNGCADWRRVD